MKHFVLTVFLFASVLFGSAQTGSKSVALVRIVEANAVVRTVGQPSSGIYISYSDGTNEVLPIENIKPNSFVQNNDKIVQAMSQLVSKGYTLVSSSTMVEGLIITTLIYEKK